MTKLKGIFVNDNFGNILYDLFSKNYEYIADDYLYDYVLDIKEMSISDIKEVFEIGDCLVFILECSRDLFHFYYEFKFHRDVHKVYLNCYSKLPYENDDDLVLLNGYCVSFDDKLIDSLFNLPQKIEEKTTSEPEQPAEEKVQSTLKYVLSCNKTKLYNLVKAKSPFDLPKLRDTYYEHSKGIHWFTYTSKNSRYVKCSFGSSYGAFLLRVEAFEYDEVFELSFEDLLAFDLVKEVHEKNISELEHPAEENKQTDELTPLERTIFEEIENCYERYNEYAELVKVAEYGAEYNGESAEEIARYGHLANEQIFNSDYLKELISKAGLDETYQAWLAERKKQEAVGVSK